MIYDLETKLHAIV